MFGGGSGSFGVAQPPNPFGGSAQASPVNPFQGGGFGGAANSNGFGSEGTSFGGRGGGGRNSFSTRGGRTPSRGGGRSGGRIAPSHQGNAFGSPAASFSGGGRGRGSGSFGSSSSTGFDNPFASPAPSPSGFVGHQTPPTPATSFGGRGGRGAGRSGGRDGNSHTTAFGSAATVQPNIRRKSDAGGRGHRTSGTTFGHGTPGGAFVPPLPPSSPPPLGMTRKPGRGGIVAPGASPLQPAAGSVATTFGQPHTMKSKNIVTPTTDTVQDVANPFAGSSRSETTRTAFGTRETSAGGSSVSASRTTRNKRQQNAFAEQPTFHDGFQEPSGFENRFNGTKARGNQTVKSFDNQVDETTTFGQQLRSKAVGNGGTGFDALSATKQEGNNSTTFPAVKTKKKLGRGTPQSSPPPTPAMASSAPGPGDYQVIGDQKNKAELSSAENLDGTCVDMCSPAERELHIRVDELSLFEKCFPGHPGQERELVVKRFQRSSADHKLDIPSELRPPGVLRRTQLYLEQQIMDRERLGPDPRFSTPRLPELIELYNFCWDRCRMIRKDFVLQNYRGAGGRVHPIAIDVHERIARYHILSEHELCEVPSFVAQQNMEQLGQTLKSLNELYDESRKLNDAAYLSPFEAEFRGYFILCTLDNGRGSDVLKFVKGLAPQIREAPQVKFAMQVFVARHTQNYYAFFNLLRQATYLQACLVFRYIPSMRSLALERLNRAYRNQSYPLGTLVDLLCFDDFEHAESVCVHHGLDVSASEESGEDGEPVVNFGGEFETDIQLRQNKNPLPIRASHVYISQKQGDFLRGDVCRGVTEYAQEDYPPLSKLIDDTEKAERVALYPDRPVYEDEYSAFAVFATDPYETSSNAGRVQSAVQRDGMNHPRTMSSTDLDERQHELEEIAKKKAEVERTKIKMMERIQQLEREKTEKKRLALENETVSREAKQREADEKARIDAESARKQRELAAKKREEEEALRQRQLQLEAEERQRVEAARAAAEHARLTEMRRIAEEKRQAEEAQLRLQLQKAEDERRRKAAAEAERRRQLELAAEQERIAREAKRQAELAAEAARRKQLQRLEKQRLAVLKLRFRLWKRYVANSKSLPCEIDMNASALVERSPIKDHEVMEWLFGGPRAVSDFIGLHRRQVQWASDNDEYCPPSGCFWEPLDVAGIVGQTLMASGRKASGWKFVVADLLDDGLSSFGSWCAVKSGIASASIDEDENISSVHSTQWSEASSLAVCCRYLGANFLRSLSANGREKRLAGTSAMILPLDLGHALDRSKVQAWEERVHGVLAHLHPSRQVGIMVLGFCASRATRKGDALAAAEACIGRILSKNRQKIAFIDGDLILEEDVANGVEEKLSEVFKKLAANKNAHAERVVVDLSDLMDTVVYEALREWSEAIEGVSEVQEHLHQKLWNLRDTLLSPSVIDVDIPIPELQGALGAPSYGWNSREAQQKWDAVFRTLTSHKLAPHDAPIPSSKVCEVYFEQISQHVDAVFSHNYGREISPSELKRSLFGLLVPIHDDFSKQGDSLIHDASTLLPWRQIFGHIYGAFIECIQEELLYIPTKLIESLTRHSDAKSPLSLVGTTNKRSRSRTTLDASAQAAAVAFARRELKRALNIVPTQLNGVKRLRHEISRDRAAAQSYQRFLRRELDRWASADEDFPLN